MCRRDRLQFRHVILSGFDIIDDLVEVENGHDGILRSFPLRINPFYHFRLTHNYMKSL
jgi:hypothetical protein